jgi:hypothetical protein
VGLAAQIKENMMNTFSTPSPVTVVLEIPAGRVRLIASERTDTTVEVLPAEASKKRDLKAAEQTAVEYGDCVLRITSAEPTRVLGSSGSLDVTIALPAGSRIEGKAGGAELYGTGRLGDVTFVGGYRTVEIAEAASAQLQVHMGEVTVGRLTGPAQIRNGKGDVTIAEAVAGSVELRTDMGSLSVCAAGGVSATLDASTPRGRITNALKNDAGAGAALKIWATTLRGDITATSL